MGRMLTHLRANRMILDQFAPSLPRALAAAYRELWTDRTTAMRLHRHLAGPFLMSQKSDRVNLLCWSDPRFPAEENFGDALSPFIFSEVARLHGIDVATDLAHGEQVSAIGSLLHALEEGTVIWGTGYEPALGLLPHVMTAALHFDVRAVRGPLTRWELQRRGVTCPPVFGDPALLLPLFFTPESSAARAEAVVIPHFEDEATRIAADRAGITTVSPVAADWRDPVTAIANAALVISSSLHGIIVAEAYGVPAIRLTSPDMPQSFKFEDYYLSTGRPTHPVATTVEEALALTPPDLPDFTSMRDGLVASFPANVWRR